MDLTALDAAIARMPRPAPTPPPRTGLLGRAGEEVANLPINVIEGLANSAYNLTQLGTPFPTERLKIPNFFEIDDAQGFGEHATDFFLGKGGMADIVGQSLVPMSAAGKIGAAAGMVSGPKLEALKWAAGFMGPELQRPDASASDVGIAGLLGGAQGALSFLPFKARVAANLGVAALHGGYEGAIHDPITGVIAGAADFIGGIIPTEHAPTVKAKKKLEWNLQGQDTGLFHGPMLDSADTPQSTEQYTRYKQDLARQEAMNSPEYNAQQEQLLWEQASRENQLSPKEGVRLINPNGIPGHVPFQELLASYDATLPERGTAAGNAMRRFPGSVPPEAAPNRFATLQFPEPEPVLLHPPEVITGVEPRPDVSLFEGQGAEPSHPTSIFPVESVGSGPRTEADYVALKKAMRKPRAPREPKPRPDPVQVVDPPQVEPTALSVPRANIPVGAHAEMLRQKLGTMSEDMLRGELHALDNDIANTLDEEAQADYRGMRQLVEGVLEARKAPESKPAVAKEEKISFKKGDKVVHKDFYGNERTGVYTGKTSEGQARVRFDVDPNAPVIKGKNYVDLVSHSSLSKTGEKSAAPEFATLQKKEVIKQPKVKGKKKAEPVKEEPSLQEWLDEGEGVDLDPIPEGLEGQDFSFDTRVGPKPREGTNLEARPTSLPKAAIDAVERITAAIKSVVSKHAEVKFTTGEHGPDVAARYKPDEGVTVNRDKVIEVLDGWHNFNPKEKAQAIAKISSWIGHELGHEIFSLETAKNSKLFKKLLTEFNALGEKGRYDILREYHDLIGVTNPADTAYTSGNLGMMMTHYDQIHPQDMNSLQWIGLQEFFAEMSGAHIFGKLREEMLPPELKSLWQKFKEVFQQTIRRVLDSFGDVDMDLAHHNFKEILEQMHDNFAGYTYKEYKSLTDKALVQNRLKTREIQSRKEWYTVKAEEAELERIYQQRYEDAKSYGKWDMSKYPEDPNWQPEAGPTTDFNFATLQRPGSPIVGNRAFVQNEMIRHLGLGLGGAILGGIAGPNLTHNQMTMAEGIMVGGVLGFAGPIALRRFLLTAPQAGSSFKHLSAKEAFAKMFTMDGLKQLGGDASTGQGSAPATFVRWLERNLNLHLPQQLFNAIVESEGPASYAISIASDAFKKARTFKTDPAMNDAVEKYLRGTYTDAQMRAVLGNDLGAQHFGNFIITGRSAVAALQEMLASGLKDGAFKSTVLVSLQKGDYLTRMYRMFHDVDYHPTQDQIENVALQLSASQKGVIDLATARPIVEDYFHQIAAERGMYSGSRNDVGQKLDAAIFQRRNDKLGIAFRDAMGEYKDPKERIMGTLRHLYTNAISSKFYDHVSNMLDVNNGLKMSYSREEHAAEHARIEAKIAHPPQGITPEEFATLQKQKRDLEFYVPLDGSIRYGKIGGKMVNRFVRDQLASFDSPWGLMDGSIMRSMARFHNYVKIGRTALNPITVVRNMVAAPILMGISRANPLHIREAMGAMKDMSGGLGREMLEHGIYGVDQVRGEFFRSAEQILMGDYDHTGLEGIFKTGMNKVLEFYRMPDMIARGTTYISAKKRFSAELKLPETDRQVIDAARDWTNRYTVNYANVAPMVKTLRQVPFTNLFISYTAEITRIAKNLVEDIFTHKDVGQRVWAAGAIGGLVAIPFIMERSAIASMSPKDQEEWNKTQAQLPDYSRSRFRVVVGKEGNKFRYLDITPLLQVDSLLQMMRSAGNNDWKSFAAINPVFGWDNTPLLNIAAEQIAGKDLRTGRPLNTPVRRAQEVLKEIVPPLAPGGYEYQRASEALSVTDTGELGQTNLRTGKRTTPSELVTSYLTGMRLAVMDTDIVHRNVVSDAKRQIANEASYYRDIAVTNLPAATKQKAAERYRKAVESILLDMNKKLEGQVP
jgi:hypothetical protein